MSRGVHLVPLQAGWVRQRLGLSEEELLREMKLIVRDGRVLGGADALVELAREIWWGWPLFALAQLPGAKAVMRMVYRWIARNRHQLGGGSVVKTNAAAYEHHHGTRSFYEWP